MFKIIRKGLPVMLLALLDFSFVLKRPWQLLPSP